MKKFLIICFLGLYLLVKPEFGKASHMLGSDLTWTCVGKDSFLIKLVVYTECNGASLPYPTIMFKCEKTGASIINYTLSMVSPVDITPVCDTVCTRCKSASCSFPYGIRQYTFTHLVDLSIAGSCCNILLYYGACCRNGFITTGAANANFYTEAKFDKCVSPCNSSPSFTNIPPTVICVGQDFQYSQGAINWDIDSNGMLLDSISYEWTSPLSGAGSAIGYSGSYAYDKPLYFWGFPNTTLPFPRGIQLDAATGDISFRPMKIEVTAMVIKVCDWRKINGKMTKISEVRRDMQLFIISCPNNHSPVLGGSFYKEVCAGDTVTFKIATNDYDTANTLSISWNQAIKDATWSDNNGTTKHPTGTFIWATDSLDGSEIPYSFTVFVNDSACPVNVSTSKTFEILVSGGKNKSPANFSVVDTGCGLFYFSVTNPISNVSYKWKGIAANFGGANSFIYEIKNAGKYPVGLSGISNGCNKYYSLDTLDVKYSLLLVKLPADTALYQGDSLQISPTFKNISGKLKFKWFNGDTISNPFIFKKINRSALVSISAVDSLNCITSDTMIVDVYSVDIGDDQYNCPGEYKSFKSQVGFGPKTTSISYLWFKMGNSIPIDSSNSISVKDSGTYICQVTNQIGEKVFDTARLFTLLVPRVNAGKDTTICSGIGLLALEGFPKLKNAIWSGTAVAKFNGSYYFYPKNPAITNGGIYTMLLRYTDTTGCVASDFKNITVYLTPPKPSAGIYPDQCFNNNSLQLNPSPGNGLWYGNGINNGRFYPSQAGSGIHKLVYEVKNGMCGISDSTYITVFDSVEITVSTFDNQNKYCIGHKNVELKSFPSNGTWSGAKGSIVNGKFFNTMQDTGLYLLTYQIIEPKNHCKYIKTLSLSLIKLSAAIDKKDLIICKNENLQLFAEVKNTNNLKWTKSVNSDGNFLSSVTNDSITFKPGINDFSKKQFWLFVTTIDSVCVNSTDSALIKISTIETNFKYSPTSYSQVPVDVSFTDLSTTNNANTNNWNWDFGNGQTSILQNPYIIFDSFGKYFIQLKVKNSQNCLDSLTKELNIVSSIEDEISSSLFIIPNPASEQVLIKSAGSNIEFIRLINGMGQVIISEQNIDNEQYILINDKGLRGIYLLQTGMQNGKINNSKIMFE